MKRLLIATVVLLIIYIAVVCIIWPKLDEEPVKVSEPFATPIVITPAPASEWLEEQAYQTENDASMIAKVIYGEARGIYSLTEQACVAWTILNRVDAGYGDIREVVTAPNQFCYDKDFPTVDDYGRDILKLVYDVLDRWKNDKEGRVLPADYLWFGGDGEHNYFRNSYDDFSNLWGYGLPSPYEP